MVSAPISANPLKLDVRSHTKCLVICVIATLSTFQYGKPKCPRTCQKSKRADPKWQALTMLWWEDFYRE